MNTHERDWGERKTGGLTQPLTNEDYWRQRRKIERLAAAGDDE